MAALAGLCALGELDLNLAGRGEVAARHAEPARGHLLDGRKRGVAVGQWHLAHDVFAALACVGEAVQAVHGDGERLVGLLGDGAVAHGTRLEALDDLAGRLDFVKGHGRAGARVKVEQVAQHDGATGTVDDGTVGVPGFLRARAGGRLQCKDGRGVDEVVFLARPPGRLARVGELVGHGAGCNGQGAVVFLVCLACKLVKAQACNAADRAGEAVVHDVLGDADRLKDLRGMVALDGGDAHLRHDGHDACRHGLAEVGDCLVFGQGDEALAHGVAHLGVGDVGVHGACRVAHKHGEVVRAHGVARLNHQVGAGAHALADEMVMHTAQGQKARHRYLAGHDPVGEHQYVAARLHGFKRLLGKGIESVAKSLLAMGARIGAAQPCDLEPRLLDGADALEHLSVDDGGFQADAAAVGVGVLERVAVVAEVGDGRGHDLLAKGVDGRVGDLGEQLLEVAVELAGLPGEHSERRVDAHGDEGLVGVARHGGDL